MDENQKRITITCVIIALVIVIIATTLSYHLHRRHKNQQKQHSNPSPSPSPHQKDIYAHAPTPTVIQPSPEPAKPPAQSSSEAPVAPEITKLKPPPGKQPRHGGRRKTRSGTVVEAVADAAAEGSCALCQHRREHGRCEDVHGGREKYTLPGRCVFCGERVDHGACVVARR